VLLDEQRETPFDLRFRLFGTSVRISPWFWVVAIFFYWDTIHDGPEYLLIAILCVLFSLTLHEFGHIWMGRLFGSHGYIVLQGMCGLAAGASSLHNRWKRIAVYLAGPGIQFVFWGALYSLKTYVLPPIQSDHLRATMGFLLMFNLWWPIINLLPVWPLDGGQVSRELFKWVSSNNGVRYSLALSLVTAALVTINAISSHIGGPRIPYMPVGDRFFIFFFAIFAIESFILMQAELARYHGRFRDPDDSDRLPWESDPDDWKRGR
jgi:stage IV sporulation protein FB